jgi:hypothetical protein
MVLKSLHFNLNRQEYPNEYGYNLLLTSRFYCNFIERVVFKPLKWQVQNFDRIVVNFTDNPIQFFYINTSQVLSINIKFDKKEFEEAKQNEVAEYFIRHVEDIIERLKEEGIELPTEEIIKGNELFRSGKYINKWLYQRKVNKGLNLEVCLFCELDKKQFDLILQIMKNKKVVYDQSILTLDPDPVAYQHKFKDITFIESSVLITTKTTGKNLFEIKLADE